MGYWGNLYDSLMDIKGSTSLNNVFGLGQKYKVNQSNKDFAYDQGFAKSSDVYAITNKIARNAKTVPWLLKKKTGDKIELIENGPLYDLINTPNPQETREGQTEKGILHLLLSGNVYFNPLVPVGFTTPSEVSLLHTQLVEIVSRFEGKINVPQKYIYHIGMNDITIPVEEVTHLKYTNPTKYGIDNLYGLSPLVAGYLTVVGLDNNQTASASILENQGVAGILSNEGEDFLTPTERKRQQEVLDNDISGPTKFGKIIQSFAKVKFTRLGLDPTQLKILEDKILKMRDLCNIYDVQSSHFNDPANRIQSNLSAADKMLWTNAVLPNLRSYMASYQVAVVDPYSKADFPNGQSKYFIDPDLSKVEALQVDQKKEAEKDKILVDGINVIMGMPIDIESKKAMLKEIYNLSDTMVDSLVGVEIENNTNFE
jgi:HK97 family phage portal protein